MRKGILKLDIRQMDRQAGDQMDGQMDKKRQTIYINSIGIFLAQVLRTPPPTRSPLRSKFIFSKIQISWTFQGNHIGLKKLQTAQQNFQGSKKCQYFQKDSNVDIFRGPMGPPPKQKFFGSKNGYLGSLEASLNFSECSWDGGRGPPILFQEILSKFNCFFFRFFPLEAPFLRF